MIPSRTQVEHIRQPRRDMLGLVPVGLVPPPARLHRLVDRAPISCANPWCKDGMVPVRTCHHFLNCDCADGRGECEDCDGAGVTMCVSCLSEPAVTRESGEASCAGCELSGTLDAAGDTWLVARDGWDRDHDPDALIRQLDEMQVWINEVRGWFEQATTQAEG